MGMLKGRLANRRRRIQMAAVTKRHTQMLHSLVKDHDYPLKLKTIQVKFEYVSGVLYALSSLICALDENDLQWERTYLSNAAVEQERHQQRLTALGLDNPGTADGTTGE